MYAQCCSLLKQTQTNTSGLAAVFYKEEFLWDNGMTLTYTFLDGSHRQHKKVVDTIQEWTYYANIVFDLKERADDSGSEALIRVSFCENSGDWSLVGQQIRKRKEGCTMNLGSVRDDDICTLCERSVILHEWGHTLGLLHEHQGIAARREFTFNISAVKEYYRRNNPTLDTSFIENNILTPYLHSDMSNWSEVDIQSIMIYPIDKSFTYEGNIIVMMNTELSEKDKAYMVIHYPRDVPHEKASEWTLRYALSLANIPENLIQNWNAQNVRDEFRKYVRFRWEEHWFKATVKLKNLTKEGGKRSFEVFQITTTTNFDNFRPFSRVERRYSEVQTLYRILVRAGSKPPKLQGSRWIPRFHGLSRREEIEQFVEELVKNKKELSSNALDQLRRFLQVEQTWYQDETRMNDFGLELKPTGHLVLKWLRSNLKTFLLR